MHADRRHSISQGGPHTEQQMAITGTVRQQAKTNSPSGPQTWSAVLRDNPADGRGCGRAFVDYRTGSRRASHTLGRHRSDTTDGCRQRARRSEMAT